jgi:copper chaperone CopZ
MIPLHSSASHPRCQVAPVEKQIDANQLQAATVGYLLVSGMGCPTCAMRVRNALLHLDGVLAVDIGLERGLARVHYDKGSVSPEHMPAAVTAAGLESGHQYAAKILSL